MADQFSAFDVLVAGGGNAALCAALTAAEAGRSVIVLEGAPRAMRGGNSRHTRNLRCMHDSPTALLSGAYREDEYFDDLMRVTGGETDRDLARMTIRASASCVEWMSARGVRFQPPLSGTLHLDRTNAFFMGGGKALMNSYYAAAEQRRVRVMYNAEVVDLEIRDGTFEAARVSIDGEPVQIRAKALVAAAGGFESNLEWLGEIWGDAAANFLIRGTPFNRGKLLRVLLDRGAESAGDPTQCHAVAIDARAPKFDGGIVTRLDCVPLGIVVNKFGRRFYDEARTCGRNATPSGGACWQDNPIKSATRLSMRRRWDASCRRCFRRFAPIPSPNWRRAWSYPRTRLKRRSRASTSPWFPAISITPGSTPAAPRV